MHAALRENKDLRSQCKIVFACSTHGSFELHNLRDKFCELYDIDIFECASSYPKKIDAIFSQYSIEDYQYFIKHDEDVFITSESWMGLLTQSVEILNDPANLLTTVNLSTGIPSWSKFSEVFFTEDERNSLLKKLSHCSIPNQLWGNDYSSLNKFIQSSPSWDEDGYWKAMRELGYYYQGLHPVRVVLEYPIFINETILTRYSDFQTTNLSEGFESISDRYFCNSFFCMRYKKYKKILADKSLYVDIYDEVPINRYADNNKLNFCFLSGSLGVHVIYNSIYDQRGLVNGRNLNGDEAEKFFLDQYVKNILEYLSIKGDQLAGSVHFYRPNMFIRFRNFLKHYRLLVKIYRACKKQLVGI